MNKAALQRLLRLCARWSLLSLSLAVVLLFGACLVAYFSRDNLLRYYKGQLERQLNLKISYRSSSLGLTSLRLDGVQLETRGGEPLARVERLQAQLHPWLAWRYGPNRALGQLTLIKPNLQLSYSREGQLNWSSVSWPRRLAPASLELAFRGTFEVQDGFVSYRDQRQGDYLAQVDHLQAKLQVRPDQSWSSQFRIQEGQSNPQLEGVAQAKSGNPARLQLKLHDYELDPWLRHPSLTGYAHIEAARASGIVHFDNLPKAPMATGKLQLRAKQLVSRGQTLQNLLAQLRLRGSSLQITSAHAEWRGQRLSLSGQVGQRVQVHLKTPAIPLEQLRDLLPEGLQKSPGQVALDLTAQGSLAEPELDGQFFAENLEMAGQKLRDLRANFQLDHESLHLSSLLGHDGQGQEMRAHGWLDRDEEQRLFFRMEGPGAALGQFSPWLAGLGQVQATALGSLKNPVLTGEAQLNQIPSNALGLHSGHSRFWFEKGSAFLWNGQMEGQGGQVEVPWALFETGQSQLAAEISSRGYAYNGSSLSGAASLWGNYSEGNLEALAWLDQSQLSASGMSFDNVSGAVAWTDSRLLVPHLEGTFQGNPVTVAGTLQQGQGSFWASSDSINLRNLSPLAPDDQGSFIALGQNQNYQLQAFRAVTQGQEGSAYAVGRWQAGRGPEFFAQFSDLQVQGQNSPIFGRLATVWENGHLRYFYEAAPQDASAALTGTGWLAGSRVQMANNFLTLPSLATPQAWRGEGRAFSYFGPLEGRPLERFPEQPQDFTGSLAFSGSLDLAGQKVDLQVDGRSLNLPQLTSWIGPIESPPWWQQSGLSVEDMFIDISGRARGSLMQPSFEGSLRSPWTRLSRQGGDSLAFSWRADANRNGKEVSLLGLVSPRPMDYQLLEWKGPRQSPPEADWLRTRLALDRASHWTGWIRAQAFPMAGARWLTPPWLAQQLPSGVLSTQGNGLTIGGTLWEPQLSGRVDLRQGRLWTGYRHLPIEEAFVNFASTQSATAISRFRLRSAGLTVEGRGNRTKDGSLTAQLWADDLKLQTLADFGIDTRGWQGQVDAALTFRDSRGVSPAAWLAIQGDNLSSPLGSEYAIRHLVLGQVDRQLGGIPFTGPGKGVGLRLEAGSMVVDLPEDSFLVSWDNPDQSELAASGELSWRVGPGPGQSLLGWLKAKDGPHFGNTAAPFQLQARRLGWQLTRQLLGLAGDDQIGTLTGKLSLLGQYFEQHRQHKPKLSSQPLAQLQLQDFQLEGPGSVWSGIRLSNPLQMAYQVSQNGGWLKLDPVKFDFFSKSAANASLVPAGQLQTEGQLVIAEPSTLKRKTQEGQFLRASLTQLPLQNLSFLVPQLKTLKGTLTDLQLDHQGPLLEPQSSLSLRAANMQIGGLNLTSAQGKVGIVHQGPGDLVFQFGQGADELKLLLGGESESLRFNGQARLEFDRLMALASPTLVTPWSGWSLSERSEFDMSAQLNDSQMKLLTGFAPVGSKLGGSLRAGLELKGTAAFPELTGNITLENGSMAHPAMRSALTGLNLKAGFERILLENAEPSPVLSQVQGKGLGRYTLEKLEGFLGEQPFLGQGKLEMAGLTPTYMNFNFDGDQLPFSWDGLMDGKANVHLDLIGLAKEDQLQPSLTGTIQIPQGNLGLPSQETLADLQRYRREGDNNALGLDYKVDVQVGDDVWVSFLSSSVRASGDLVLAPSRATGKPGLVGSLFLSRGLVRIPIYDINFRVRQGHAIFEEDWIPRLDNLEADTTLGNYQITARFDGRYPNLRADLVSNPPLPDADIRRLVGLGGLPSNTGTPVVSDAVNANGNQFLVNQGVTFLSNFLAGQLTEGLGRLLFMSELSFDILPTAEYVIRLAKSLDERDRFLITFAQVIGTTRFNQSLTQYGVEWRFQPNLLSRITLDNYGVARLWFQGVLRF
jgi:hypothetical protein